MDKFYESDVDIQASDKKVSYLKMCVETLKEIMDQLKWRSQHIRNIQQYLNYESGG